MGRLFLSWPMDSPVSLRVFISATTDDLGECRRRVAEVIQAKGHTAVIQDTLPPDPRELARLLEAKIKDCHAVILLVGFHYGHHLPDPNPFAHLLPAGWDGCSCTQLEFFLALHWRKHFYLFFVPEGGALDRAPTDEWRERQCRYRDHIRQHHRQVRRPIACENDAVVDVGLIAFDALLVEPIPWPEESRFDPYHPAIPPWFIGRTRELRELEDALHRQASLSLVGDTRSGKTSLLKTWAGRAKAFCRRVVYLNAQDGAGRNEIALVNQLTGITPRSPDDAADALMRWAREETDPPLILMDEGDSWIRNSAYRFFERLRGMVDQQGVLLVLATRRDLAEAFQTFQHSGSPFGNSLRTHRLALLESADAGRIAERAGGHADLLRDWAGEHPFFLQLAGWHLQRTVEVDRAVTEFREEAYTRLKEIWSGLGETERAALKAALESGPRPCFKLERRGLLKANGQPFGRVLSQWWTDDPQPVAT